MFHGIKAVIFDLDGTLIDSMWLWKQIDIDYLGRHGIELPDHLQEDISGMSFSETAVYFKKRFGLQDSTDVIKEDWNLMANELYATSVPLKPGAGQFLKMLKQKGIVTGIATSNSRELLDTVLEKLQITPYLTSVHTACEVGKGKPAPDIYLHVAEQLQVASEHCLVFEDILPGILAGKSAGMRVCAVQDDFSRLQEQEKRKLADYFIEDYISVDWKAMGLN